jgi:phosphate transport system substrate-binding protein
LARDVQETSRLSVTLRFRYNSIELDNKALKDVGVLAQFLEFLRQTRPDRKLVLAGFSDSEGRVDRNVALSLERANAVKQAVLHKLGDPEYGKLLDTRGFGPALPVACNENDAGREKNRRVEAWLR